ncbi:aldehyde dehydrogenase [Sphingobacterium daejeonense]|uniref:aldehyde dehydrogenase n=1 Tax=Sphingobacterium daejeonense TaxID=371142 RepID=UPI0010C3FF08|nr:aldehyde dehydrogenase [Sphingobacterium daejeonense]VTP91520.1 Putative aldehyde dehydrogenase SA1924 [Sphingobacterium daejeonense]
MTIKRKYDKLFIGGEWIASEGNNVLELHSQHDQSVTGSIVLATQADIDKAVAMAKKAFDSGVWTNKSVQERIDLLKIFDELHISHAKELAELVTSENGIPIFHTLGLQGYLTYQTQAFIHAAENFGWEVKQSETPNGGATLVRREAVGVVAAVIPWNVPQQASLVKIVPALLAGCTVILKPTPETTLNAYALGELFNEAGLPKGVLSILPADREVSQYLVSHPDIDKIAFTGSTKAGQTIASIAGSQMKRVSLELGGKSAAIVLEDADPKIVAEGIKYKTFLSNGQVCIGLTRILVPETRYKEITEALAEMVGGLKVGDPTKEDTYVGPLFNEVQFNKVQGYIQSGIDEGAKVLTGGVGKSKGKEFEKGFYVKPTLFVNANNNMKIAREEIFGPVIAAIPYKTLDEAIETANDTDYGLSGGVFTADPEKGIEVARKIKTGTIGINLAAPGFNDPFGGYKQSGIGREFGVYGLNSFTELKALAY